MFQTYHYGDNGIHDHGWGCSYRMHKLSSLACLVEAENSRSITTDFLSSLQKPNPSHTQRLRDLWIELRCRETICRFAHPLKINVQNTIYVRHIWITQIPNATTYLAYFVRALSAENIITEPDILKNLVCILCPFIIGASPSSTSNCSRRRHLFLLCCVSVI